MKRLILSSGVVAALVTAGLMPLAAEVVEQVVVKVNGEIVSKSELEQRQIAALRQRPEFANSSPDSEQIRTALAEITPELILSVVDELLMVQRGKELGYTLSDEQFNGILENIKKENKIERDEDFQAALKQEGMTISDLRRQLERQMLVSRVQQVEVSEKVSVTEEEARTHYDANRSSFTTPSEITLREILIEVPTSQQGVNVAQDEAARAKAEEVRSRLVAGEPFAQLAGELSDAPSRANGGLIGPFKGSDLAESLRKVIAPLNVGDISPVIRIARGYQILKLESRTTEEVQSFENARPAIADRVADEKFRAEMRKYLDRLREQAIIQWRNDELKKAYELALERRKAPAAVVQ
jgi:peptidyl-prolyl cis-trans isomerase SurA